ncbi:hypothetical protein WG66_002861 [Moniliophthora roreri]|nr:hypothetical protein WG66_003249 [Moniliophthora roreri]KAI3619711.1 hypothetical protein WG66_002861 [Moniliophthora roreri]
MSQPLTETLREHPKTKRISTPLSIMIGSEEIRSKEEVLPTTLKKPELDILNTSSTLAEELDPFQRLLHALKNSPRSMKQPQLEEMVEDKKPLGSRPKDIPVAKEAIISATVSIQVVAAEKEVKATLPRAFTGHRKDAKKFLQEVLLYIALNPKIPGEFWKNNKTDLLLAFDADAEKVSWGDFVEDFKMSFKPLNTALEAQLKLQDLKMKERADKYMYQFSYLAKQMGYNDAAQIVAFK